SQIGPCRQVALRGKQLGAPQLSVRAEERLEQSVGRRQRDSSGMRARTQVRNAHQHQAWDERGQTGVVDGAFEPCRDGRQACCTIELERLVRELEAVSLEQAPLQGVVEIALQAGGA